MPHKCTIWAGSPPAVFFPHQRPPRNRTRATRQSAIHGSVPDVLIYVIANTCSFEEYYPQKKKNPGGPRWKPRYLAALLPATDQWVIPVLCTEVNAFGTIPVLVSVEVLQSCFLEDWSSPLGLSNSKRFMAVTQFEERHGKREARRRAMTIRHLLERKGQCLWTIGPNTTVRDAICRNG